MAIIRPAAIVSAISGSIGGQTFVNARAGLVARTRTYRKPNHSAALLQNQATFANIARRWRLITQEQRTAWRRLAAINPQKNRLGSASAQSGYQLYLRVTTNRLHAQGALFDDPPNIQPVTIDPESNIGFVDATLYVVTLRNNATPDTAFGQIWGSRHLSFIQPRIPPPFRLILRFQFNNLAFTSLSVRPEWTAIFGNMEIDEAFSIRLIYYHPTTDLLPRTPEDSTHTVLAT